MEWGWIGVGGEGGGEGEGTIEKKVMKRRTKNNK